MRKGVLRFVNRKTTLKLIIEVQVFIRQGKLPDDASDRDWQPLT